MHRRARSVKSNTRIVVITSRGNRRVRPASVPPRPARSRVLAVRRIGIGEREDEDVGGRRTTESRRKGAADRRYHAEPATACWWNSVPLRDTFPSPSAPRGLCASAFASTTDVRCLLPLFPSPV